MLENLLIFSIHLTKYFNFNQTKGSGKLFGINIIKTILRICLIHSYDLNLLF